MRKITNQSLTGILLSVSMSMNGYAAPAIGMATARGGFKVDNVRVVDNSTLFDGSAVETAAVASEINLPEGAKMVLAPESKALMFHNKLVLEKGEAQVSTNANYVIQTQQLKIVPEGKDMVARLSVKGSDQLHLTAINGAFSVRNSGGVVLANLAAGNSLDISNSGATSSETHITGRLAKKGDKYIVKDEITNTIFEVHGENLDGQVGQRVEVSGTAVSAEGKAGPTAVKATSVKVISKGHHTAAIVTGVVVVSAAGAGLGLGLTKSESKSTISR